MTACPSSDVCRGRTAFTLVELMVGMLLAAVLALAAGSMLASMMSGWRDGTRAVNLQRDATAAMDTMIRMIQVSAPSELAWSAGRLDLATNHTRNRPSRIAREDTRLVFDPDRTAGGNEVVLIGHYVDDFSYASSGNIARITLKLSNDSEVVTIRSSAIALRNPDP